MAASTATVTVTNVERSLNVLRVTFTVAISAGTYATPGIPLSFANQALIISSSAPSKVTMWGQKSSNSGWEYAYNPGATPSLSSGKIQAFGQNSTTGPLIEMANGTTDAGMTGDKIIGEATFQYGV